MPVILKPEDEALWLDRKAFDYRAINALLRPYPADEMEAYPVTAAVGSVQTDDPSCIEPVAWVKEYEQETLIFDENITLRKNM
jgi:putative SOS response-associated peptidase YedK